MIPKYNRASVQAERETDAAVRCRAEQMLRESLAAQIKLGLITPGERLNPTALRRELDDCTRAAIYAVRWEQAHPGQQWLPSFTDSNRADGLSEQRYRQYASPVSKEL